MTDIGANAIPDDDETGSKSVWRFLNSYRADGSDDAAEPAAKKQKVENEGVELGSELGEHVAHPAD